MVRVSLLRLTFPSEYVLALRMSAVSFVKLPWSWSHVFMLFWKLPFSKYDMMRPSLFLCPTNRYSSLDFLYTPSNRNVSVMPCPSRSNCRIFLWAVFLYPSVISEGIYSARSKSASPDTLKFSVSFLSFL